MDPGSAAHRHSASKTRVNALTALRSIRGTRRSPGGKAKMIRNDCSLGFGRGDSTRRRYRRGTGNEGVGEHVRTRFHLGKDCR
jgi:hypothetical protein